MSGEITQYYKRTLVIFCKNLSVLGFNKKLIQFFVGKPIIMRPRQKLILELKLLQ